MDNPFKKATKYESKLRMNLAGVSGSGKTYTSLAIGCALSDKVALVDTEHGSASKYAELFDFDTITLGPPYHPDRFIKAINAAEEAGYEVLILDSLSHAWFGTGGLLEIVDGIAARSKNPNSFAAWKDATPIQNRLVEAILTSKLHIIATMRSKQEYIVETDDRGKQAPRKVGMAPIQRDGIEYEFDVFGEMTIDNSLLIQKSRCPALSGQIFRTPGKEIAAILSEWLTGTQAMRTIEPPLVPMTEEWLPITDQGPTPTISDEDNLAVCWEWINRFEAATTINELQLLWNQCPRELTRGINQDLLENSKDVNKARLAEVSE